MGDINYGRNQNRQQQIQNEMQQPRPGADSFDSQMAELDGGQQQFNAPQQDPRQYAQQQQQYVQQPPPPVRQPGIVDKVIDIPMAPINAINQVGQSLGPVAPIISVPLAPIASIGNTLHNTFGNSGLSFGERAVEVLFKGPMDLIASPFRAIGASFGGQSRQIAQGYQQQQAPQQYAPRSPYEEMRDREDHYSQAQLQRQAELRHMQERGRALAQQEAQQEQHRRHGGGVTSVKSKKSAAVVHAKDKSYLQAMEQGDASKVLKIGDKGEAVGIARLFLDARLKEHLDHNPNLKPDTKKVLEQMVANPLGTANKNSDFGPRTQDYTRMYQYLEGLQTTGELKTAEIKRLAQTGGIADQAKVAKEAEEAEAKKIMAEAEKKRQENAKIEQARKEKEAAEIKSAVAGGAQLQSTTEGVKLGDKLLTPDQAKVAEEQAAQSAKTEQDAKELKDKFKEELKKGAVPETQADGTIKLGDKVLNDAERKALEQANAELQKESTKTSDGKDDGNISIPSKVGNLAKGAVLQPTWGLAKNVASFAWNNPGTTAAAVVVGVPLAVGAYTMLTIPTLAAMGGVAAAGALGLGGWQMSKAADQIQKADTDDKAKAGWYNLGGATSSTALGVAGGVGAAKALTGIGAEGAYTAANLQPSTGYMGRAGTWLRSWLPESSTSTPPPAGVLQPADMGGIRPFLNRSAPMPAAQRVATPGDLGIDIGPVNPNAGGAFGAGAAAGSSLTPPAGGGTFVPGPGMTGGSFNNPGTGGGTP